MGDGSKADIQFTYDPKQFVESLDRLANSMDKMAGKSQITEKTMSKAVASGMMKFAVLGTAIKKAFEYGVSAVNKFIPEVGQTFSIAGDIIMRNFLWPIRKTLIPLLQKVLDWTRQNRKLFVQLGETVVNVFKGAVAIIKGLFTLLQPVITPIIKLFKDLFGGTTKSITETINLAIFKIVTFALVLETILKPVFDLIGQGITNLLTFWTAFVKGFGKNVDIGALSKYFKALKGLFDTLGFSLSGLNEGLKKFGDFMGQIAGTALNILIKGMTELLNISTELIKIFTGTTDKQNAFTALAKGDTTAFKQYQKGGTKVQDAIITKDGKVIHTHPDDNIIATKKMGGGFGGGSIVMTNNIYLNVTEGNSRNAGLNLIDGLEQGLRNKIQNGLLAEGGR